MPDPNKYKPNYDLLAKYFAGEASVAEKNDIESWININSENKKAFDSMYFLWIQSSKSELTKQVNVSSAWEKMQNRMSLEKKEFSIAPGFDKLNPRKIPINKMLKRVLQIAAVVIFGVIIKFSVDFLQSDSEYLSEISNQKAVEINLAHGTSL